MLLLLPSEAKMKERLETHKIPVKVIKINPKQQKNITSQIEGFIASDPELKYLAQKVFYINLYFLYPKIFTISLSRQN